MRESLGWVASLALVAGLVSAMMGWELANTVSALTPFALLAVAAILGAITWRKQAGKVAAVGGLLGIALWVWRICWHISEGAGSPWQNG